MSARRHKDPFLFFGRYTSYGIYSSCRSCFNQEDSNLISTALSPLPTSYRTFGYGIAEDLVSCPSRCKVSPSMDFRSATSYFDWFRYVQDWAIGLQNQPSQRHVLLHSATAENTTPPSNQRAERPPLRVTRDGFGQGSRGSTFSLNRAIRHDIMVLLPLVVG
jgi:hypothetical protein